MTKARNYLYTRTSRLPEYSVEMFSSYGYTNPKLSFFLSKFLKLRKKSSPDMIDRISVHWNRALILCAMFTRVYTLTR